jgi:hypothetical protein
VNPDVFAGPARRLTPEEWAEKTCGVRLVDERAILEAERAAELRTVVAVTAPGSIFADCERTRMERRAQGGRG